MWPTCDFNYWSSVVWFVSGSLLVFAVLMMVATSVIRNSFVPLNVERYIRSHVERMDVPSLREALVAKQKALDELMQETASVVAVDLAKMKYKHTLQQELLAVMQQIELREHRERTE